MNTAAVFAILALIVTVVWQLTRSPMEGAELAVTPENVNSAADSATPKSYYDWQRVPESGTASQNISKNTSDPDGISNIGQNVIGTLVGAYVTMKDAGTYTPSSGADTAELIAEDLRANVSYRTYSANELQIDSDTSPARMLSYRNDLRIALEPLLKNSQYELTIFAEYVDTGDTARLTELEEIAENYRDAVKNLLLVPVPATAASHHISVLNALSGFETTISRMASNANDPYASAALLRSFNTAEMDLFTSFNELAGYFRAYINS